MKEEKEVEEDEQDEAEERSTNQDDEDGEEVKDVAEDAAYQPMEEAVVAQIDHSIEERVKWIRDIGDVPEFPMGEPISSINKGMTSRPQASPTSTVPEESPAPIVGPATYPPAPVTPP